MANPGWYPQRRADRPPWHSNLETETAATGTTVGLTAGQFTQIGEDADTVTLVVGYTESIDAFRQEVTAFAANVLEGDPLGPVPVEPASPANIALADGTLPGIEARTRGFVAIIKASPNHPQARGSPPCFCRSPPCFCRSGS